MDLILIALLLIALILSSQYPYASSQTCAATTTSSSQVVNLFTNNPTVSIGGGTGTTLNVGKADSPTTNTVNIGGTGSTVNVGPPTGPLTTAPVNINGVNQNDWNVWYGTTDVPVAAPNAGSPAIYFKTVSWGSVPSPSPSLNPASTISLITCPTASPTSYPGVAVSESDCLQLSPGKSYEVCYSLDTYAPVATPTSYNSATRLGIAGSATYYAFVQAGWSIPATYHYYHGGCASFKVPSPTPTALATATVITAGAVASPTITVPPTLPYYRCTGAFAGGCQLKVRQIMAN